MTDPIDQPRRTRPKAGRGRRIGVLVGVGVLVLGSAVLYGMKGAGKEGAVECRGSEALAARLDPLVRGEVAALNLSRPAKLMPNLAFTGPDGQPTNLAAFKGRTVLVNLWATWCVPCRKEMPALDGLQARRGSDSFQVVPINIDTARLDRPKAFLQEIGVTKLPLYTDPSANVFQVLRQDGQALGLPTTLLVDPKGCAIGVMAGPAEWNSPEALTLIDAATSG